MARRRRSGGGRTTPRGTRPRNWADPSGATPVRPRRPARVPELFDILLAVSQTCLSLVPDDRFTGLPDLGALPNAVANELAVGTEDVEALTVVAELLGDHDIQQLIARRHPPAPAIEAMLELIRGAEIDDTFAVRDPWDEHRSYGLGVRLANGERSSAIVQIDVFGSMSLADGFAGPVGIEVIRDKVTAEPDLVDLAADRADIHRHLIDASEVAGRTVPPVVTDTWPSHRVLVEWMVSLLPPASPVADWEPLSDSNKTAFVDGFLASDHRRALAIGDDDLAAMVQSLLWYKDGYTNGDLHRWGPSQVAVLLGDWALRKLMVPERELRTIPAILRALIPWCHGHIDELEPRHTAEVLEAVDHFESEFLDGLKPDRLTGIDALMDAAGPYLGFDPSVAGFTGDLDTDYAILEARWRAGAVGGEEALDTLSADPLPVDDSIDVSGVDEPYRSLVDHIAGRAGEVAADIFGPEYGTAAARIAVRLGETDSAALARGKPESAIASIVWLAAAANRNPWSIVQADIKEAAGSKVGPKDRARTFTKVLGGEFEEYREVLLGSPDFLTGARRQQLIDAHQEAKGSETGA